MIKTEKINNKLVLTIEVNHELIDDCFLFSAINSASQGKALIMDAAGKAYEDYVKSLAKESDIEYLNEEFSSVKLAITIQ